jgi:CBS domain-containing protein
MTSAPPQLPLQRLPVRRCTVLDADGGATIALNVYCAARQRMVPVETCEQCIHVDALPEHGFVMDPIVECRSPVPEPTSSREPSGDLGAARSVAVRDVMSMGVICVRANTRAETAAALLVEHHVRSVPVVDEDRRLLGIVSKTDLMQVHAALETKVVADLMTPLVHSLPDDAPLAYAIALMASDSLLEVPIVSSSAQLVGIVTALDVMRWVSCELGYVVVSSGAAPTER